MENTKYIIEAQAILPDGQQVRGPVTSVDHHTFIFHDHNNDSDLRISMNRGDLGWTQLPTDQIQQSQQLIDEIGIYIDNALGNSPLTKKITIE
jgi:hypothetical protein